jgi:phosphate transport system ATP-binding protein
MTGPAIDIRRLSVSFRGRPALEDVTLSMPARTISVLIGPSGSGKTTLLRAVNRLNECFDDCRTTGSVWLGSGDHWRDVNAAGYPLELLRRQAAMCFQHPNPLPGSIADNFRIPLRSVLGLSPSEIEARMLRSLRETELEGEVGDRLHAAAKTLSGGQQQRLCLARALALEPTCLLLDEPTANLDFRSTSKIEELLHRLKTRYTILAVSHNLSQARRLADQVAVLREGSLVQVLDRGRLEDADSFYRQVESLF